MQKVTVIIFGRGGELDRATVSVPLHSSGVITIRDVVDKLPMNWVLGDGDVIRIVIPE